MTAANVPLKMKYKLFRELFMCAMQLDQLTIIEIDGVEKTRIEHWGADLPKFTKDLRTWGESGVVTVKTIATPKVCDRGVTCILAGYAINHASGVYRMWDAETNGVHITRDVLWLRRMFYQQLADIEKLSIGFDLELGESEDYDLISTETPVNRNP